MSPQKTLHCRHCVLGGSVCVGLGEEEEGVDRGRWGTANIVKYLL